ncbi:hypothetical protein ZMO01_01150 [Zymomonas mobilis subsp. mobilis]|nr:hypothetical protein ZMO01_01150 [Zymomonas mobilis subsp. mobilis]
MQPFKGIKPYYRHHMIEKTPCEHDPYNAADNINGKGKAVLIRAMNNIMPEERIIFWTA